MPYNPSNVPDAPLPISMLPDAEALTPDDLLLVTQPANTTARSRRLKLSSLLSSGLFSAAAWKSGAAMVSNVFTYSGALPQFPPVPANPAVVLTIDCPPWMDVQFRVWGTSNSATGLYFYDYGLTGRVRQYYQADDVDRDQIMQTPAGSRFLVGSEVVEPRRLVYDSCFRSAPYDYSQYYDSPAIFARYPTKQVSLGLWSGVNPQPSNQATPPSSYSLNIQAVLTPALYGLITPVSGG